ncbi:MAG: PqiC family protein [Chromatiales bacterium]|nr:PqiC family protein [Chromatiales bacterium]
MRLPLIALVCLLLGACGTTEVRKFYYVLEQPAVKTSVEKSGRGATSNKSRKRIVLEPLLLPDHLRLPNLLFKQQQNMIHPARQHLWGDALDRSISRFLALQLTSRNRRYQVESLLEAQNPTSDYRIKLRIDQFYPTYQNVAVLSGHLWISDRKKRVLVNRPFSKQLLLEEDGYPHAVQQLQQLLLQLTDDLDAALIEAGL